MTRCILMAAGLLLAPLSQASKQKEVKLEGLNRIVVGIGAGPTGLKLSKDSKYVLERTGVVAGLYYQRKLEQGYIIGLGAETNRTVTLQFGKDF